MSSNKNPPTGVYSYGTSSITFGTPVTVVEYHCPYCGSQALERTALANWSVPNQRWEAQVLLDHYTCAECKNQFEDLPPTLKPD